MYPLWPKKKLWLQISQNKLAYSSLVWYQTYHLLYSHSEEEPVRLRVTLFPVYDAITIIWRPYQTSEVMVHKGDMSPSQTKKDDKRHFFFNQCWLFLPMEHSEKEQSMGKVCFQSSELDKRQDTSDESYGRSADGVMRLKLLLGAGWSHEVPAGQNRVVQTN